MREKLNENPIAQVVLVGVLVVVGAFLFISSSGGGEESEEAPAGEVAASVNGVTATGSSPGEAVESAVESLESGAAAAAAEAPSSVPTPPPPKRLTAAYEAGKTVVLLIVHNGSIDNALAARSSQLLAPLRDVSLFVVPAKQIARYAAITVGLEVNRVPAPDRDEAEARSAAARRRPPSTTAFQTPQSVVQAVLDANYHGREVAYHPN